ncbi:MAG: hypothetical protein COA52_00465 [Hyphomicrobiales bacterium]|nr:MAG: hypothetical protein COA52_00465 [Hyphomicrobiales bacterium]
MKYRKKPIVIEACQITITNFDKPSWWPNWLQSALYESNIKYNDKTLLITTTEGVLQAALGDYIIQGIQGELYPCKPDIFEATYEIVK